MKTAKSIEERINEAIADANAYIDKHAKEVAKTCPGVPLGSIRNSITRGMGCACAAALLIAKEQEAQDGRVA